jgi:hypothetical protein
VLKLFYVREEGLHSDEYGFKRKGLPGFFIKGIRRLFFMSMSAQNSCVKDRGIQSLGGHPPILNNPTPATL